MSKLDDLLAKMRNDLLGDIGPSRFEIVSALEEIREILVRTSPLKPEPAAPGLTCLDCAEYGKPGGTCGPDDGYDTVLDPVCFVAKPVAPEIPPTASAWIDGEVDALKDRHEEPAAPECECSKCGAPRKPNVRELCACGAKASDWRYRRKPAAAPEGIDLYQDGERFSLASNIEIATLKGDLATNAALLARQCDLARVAEKDLAEAKHVHKRQGETIVARSKAKDDAIKERDALKLKVYCLEGERDGWSDDAEYLRSKWERKTGTSEMWDDLKARCDTLRAALLRHGHHDDGDQGERPCDFHTDGPDTCSCGFDAALRATEGGAR